MRASSISVVVSVYNAQTHIASCLDALLALDYPKDRLEILVVDNASTDHTAQMVRRYPVICLYERQRGTTAARNTGIAVARGEIIAFTDADCVVEPSWAQAINRTFQDPAVDAVLGYTGGIDENFWAELEQKNFEEFWYRTTRHGRSLRRIGIDTRNSAVRRAVLTACGNFNAELPNCGDLDLSVRLRAGDYTVVLNESMRAAHHNRTDLARILRIKRNHARAFVQIVAGQPEGLDSPHLPSDFRKFLGIDNRTIHGFALKGARLGLSVLRPLLVVVLRAMSRSMSRPNRWAVKIFKTLCGLSWELVFLEARERQEL